MGAWGTAVFSNDTSSDVRSEFRDLIADGLEPREATDRLVASYRPDRGEDASDFWLGLALTQHRLGRLLPEVHDETIRAAEQEDLGRWEPDDRNKRVRAVRRALAELAEPQPDPNPVRRQAKAHTELLPGQHFLYEFSKGRRVLFRVHDVRDGSPLLTLLRWSDSVPVPRGDHLLTLGPHETDDDRWSTVGVRVFGAADPASRITMLPERMPAPQAVKAHWWSRRGAPSPDEDISRPLTTWRSLPKWFTADGRLRIPRG